MVCKTSYFTSLSRAIFPSPSLQYSRFQIVLAKRVEPLVFVRYKIVQVVWEKPSTDVFPVVVHSPYVNVLVSVCKLFVSCIDTLDCLFVGQVWFDPTLDCEIVVALVDDARSKYHCNYLSYRAEMSVAVVSIDRQCCSRFKQVFICHRLGLQNFRKINHITCTVKEAEDQAVSLINGNQLF